MSWNQVNQCSTSHQVGKDKHKRDCGNEDNKDENSNKVKPKASTIERRRKVTKTPKSSKKIETNKQSEIEPDIMTKKSIDIGLIENVILEVRKNPRISLWSAKSAAVLRLLKKTRPEFSISKEASALIEEAVKDKYPDLWDEFEDREI